MSKDYSEYKASKYDEYLKSRTPENGTVLNVFKNRANINIDNQTVEISVDSDNEYFSENFRYLNLGDEFNLYLNTHRDIICEIRKRVLDITDYEKAYEAKQKFNSASGKIIFDFADEKQIRNNFYFMNPKVVIPEKINIFSFSRIRLDLFEGILDFIYADFLSPLNFLINSYESLSGNDFLRTDNRMIYSDKQKEYELLLDYEKTVTLLKPLLYASIYSGICPPRFDYDYDFIEQLRWYGNYLINLQNEYTEMIRFCFDDDYYPNFFLGSSRVSRYLLYKEIKGLPYKSYRTEEMTFNNIDANGNHKLTDENYISKDAFYMEYNEDEIEFAKETELDFFDMTGILSCFHNLTESYVFGNVDEILELEFTKMLKSNIKIKKCKRCGKYFRLKGNYHTDYCSRIAEGEGRNCREIAATEKYKRKTADNQALQIYNKYYKRYMARVKVNQIKEEKFKEWQFESLSMRDACERKWITVEEYIDFNESYFPNRKKKETK